MNKKLLALMILLFCTNIESSQIELSQIESSQLEPSQLESSQFVSTQILNLSIPKAGTYVLRKTVGLIVGKECWGDAIMSQTYVPSIDLVEKFTQVAGFSGFLCLHLIFKPEYENFLKKNNIKALFIYRDPRDQLVSQAYFMLKHSMDHGRFTFDSLLSALIGNNNKSPQNILHPFQDVTLNILSSQEYISHIKRFYEGFLGWKNSGVCYATRFEDLVGPNGGGTVEQQKREVSNIAKHIVVDLTEQQITDIASNIFGSTWSFREGKIGSWKTHFKEEHIKAFKAVAGDLLIKLGYEENNEW